MSGVLIETSRKACQVLTIFYGLIMALFLLLNGILLGLHLFNGYSITAFRLGGVLLVFYFALNSAIFNLIGRALKCAHEQLSRVLKILSFLLLLNFIFEVMDIALSSNIDVENKQLHQMFSDIHATGVLGLVRDSFVIFYENANTSFAIIDLMLPRVNGSLSLIIALALILSLARSSELRSGDRMRNL